MINWNCITNVLSVTGRPREIEKFMAAVKGKRGPEEESHFSFNRIVPMPKELMGTMIGANIINGVCCEQWRDIGSDGAPEAISAEEQERIKVAAGGCKDWDEWNRKNWGARLDALHQDKPKVQRAANGKTVTVTYRFDTTWAPPMRVLEAVSKMFPTVMLNLCEDSEGYDHWNEYSIINGEITHTDTGHKRQ